MMNDNENMVSDAAAQDMELTDPQGSEPQSADARNAQEASSCTCAASCAAPRPWWVWWC